MTHPQPFLLEAGHPFTLWLDPARWPVPALRLPGHGFTLWTRPSFLQARRLQLPGLSHTLWVDPVRWPVARLRLPSAGHTLWLDPDKWHLPVLSEIVPLPSSATEPEPIPASNALAATPMIPGDAPFLNDPAPTPAGLPFPSMPISIPQNKAFTLWTRPQHVSPIPMKNGLTAAQLAAASPAASIAISTPSGPTVAPPSVIPTPTLVLAPASSGGVWEKWLPLAAAVVAVLGVHSLMSISASKRESLDSAEVSQMQVQIGEATKGMAGMKTQLAADSAAFGEKMAQMEATTKSLKEQKELLVTQLAGAMDANRKAEAKQTELNAMVRQLSIDLDKARLEASTAGTQAEGRVVAAMEEASRIKREAEGEVVRLKEALGKSEAEKAAALKAAAVAAAPHPTPAAAPVPATP